MFNTYYYTYSYNHFDIILENNSVSEKCFILCALPIHMFLGILICHVNINYMKILALHIDNLKIGLELISNFYPEYIYI
jgi:hypothetical protein